MDVVRIGDVLKTAARLAGESDTPNLDLQVLLASITGRDRAWVLAHPEVALNLQRVQQLEAALHRLEVGEPLAYLTGRREFYGLEFMVTPAVLVPRPETEILVEQALTWLQCRSQYVRCADVGTGSGCIGVTLAVHAQNAFWVITDLSLEALQVARRNALRHQVAERVLCVQGSLLEALGTRFDLICANLPYIPQDELERLKVSRWEPRLALDGGPDGLTWVCRLMKDAPRLLAPQGLMVLEIEAGQGAAVSSLARERFPAAEIQVIRDLAGFDRVVRIQL